MSAASRSVQAAPNSVQAGVAFAAILLTAALVLVLFAVARPATSDTQSAPAAGSAPTLHDRGWATAGQAPAAAAPVLHDRGLATAGQASAAAPILHDRGSSSAAIAAAAAAAPSVGTTAAAPGARTAGPDGARRHR